MSVLLVVIPTEHQGALETAMLDAISEDEYDRNIVVKTGDFAKKMRAEASKYISTDRLELKAHLSLTWAVQLPEKVFTAIDEQIKSVRWEDSETLNDCFFGVGVNTAPDGFFRKNQQSPLPTAEKYDIIISSPIPPKGRQLNEQNLNRNSKLFSQRTPGNRNNRNAGQNNHKAEISYPFL